MRVTQLRAVDACKGQQKRVQGTEVCRRLHDRHFTALILTLLKIYEVESPWTQSVTALQKYGHL